ncbi:M23 family metallopeptidase [Nocardioides euryhalodurans]|uniref:M23 family metallopeptidase n=1 Tax=Nocardioides euryhalodurans TaxID=2518370 RepID=A0A4P7GGZ8_9ACTN|nr:M23 family metallopeptidase [Nocardioides euryhalodurans]QBR91004.1 M23 family metallopeptidase [Nocardioides euryhalodurans]
MTTARRLCARRSLIGLLVTGLVTAPTVAATASDPTPLGSGPGLAPDRASEPLTGTSAAARASAAPESRFQMPFPCGQQWTGSTRDSHSPSRYSVDWNRADDVDDPVVASAPGVVVRAERLTTSYGHWVRIEHPSGETTVYAHMNDLTVALGQSVDQGTQIGTVGNTGNSFGAHLHFEERTAAGSVRWPWFDGSSFTFGSTLASRNCVDVPLAGDFLRDDRAELGVFRRGTPAQFRIRRPGRRPQVIALGAATDQPVVGDWDGDGRSDVGVRTPATRTFTLRTAAGTSRVVLGYQHDLPIAGDWDGDGIDDVGVRRARSNRFVMRMADGTTTGVQLGDVDDLPVTGDWDGDGVTDLGVYDQASATFTLRITDEDGLVWTASVPFGQPGDLPVTGDWDANLKTDVGVWTPTTGVFAQRRATAPTAARSTTSTIVFGNPR